VILVATRQGPLRGEVSLPGDKSIAHRAALLGALARGRSRIDNFLVAGVTQAMLRVLAGLGVSTALDDDTLEVEGRGGLARREETPSLDCGHSATTMRLAAGALVGAGVGAVLDGTPSLRRRPMGPLVEVLSALGGTIESDEGGHAPIRVRPRSVGSLLPGGEVVLQVASAQLKSAALLAGLGAAGPVSVVEPGPSRDHTERLLDSMGALIERDRARGMVTLHPPMAGLRPLELTLPGDISSAAFLIAAALVTPGSAITLNDVGINPGRTGLLETIREMGGHVEILPGGERSGEPFGTIRVESSELHGVEVAGDRVVRMIDEFPVFAVLACCARGDSTVRQAAALREKESDRIGTLCRELRSVGGMVEEAPDGFSVRGSGGLRGGRARAHRDHRLALSLAVAGMASAAPVEIEGAEIIGESFPGFAATIGRLGGRLA
jgi:3-phosphoshikimate 1-carboxyvinyltransferase